MYKVQTHKGRERERDIEPYLLQSVEGLILLGMLTPHLLGSPAARPRLKAVYGTPLTACFRHLQTLWRSAVV